MRTCLFDSSGDLKCSGVGGVPAKPVGNWDVVAWSPQSTSEVALPLLPWKGSSFGVISAPSVKTSPIVLHIE